MREVLALTLFFLSLAGLFILQPKTVHLSQVRDVGKVYRVCGTLVPIKELSKGCIYRFFDEGTEMKAIAFFGECRSGYACIYGRLDTYRGEREIVILSYS